MSRKKWTYTQRINALANRKRKAEPARKAEQRRQLSDLKGEQARLKAEAEQRRSQRPIEVPPEP